MPNPYLPPRTGSSGRTRRNLWASDGSGSSAAPAGLPGWASTAAGEPEDSGDRGGLFGLGFGPDINLGIGSAVREIGQGVSMIPGLVGDLAPGGTPAGDRWSVVGKGLVSSFGGLASTAMKPFTTLPDAVLGTDLEGKFERGVGRLLGDEEQFKARDFWETARERGLASAAFETIGNVSIVGGAATAGIKGASIASRAAGAGETAARLAVVHERALATPLIRAAQHPYRTAGRAFTNKVTQPATARVLAHSGVIDEAIPPAGSVPDVDAPPARLPDDIDLTDIDDPDLAGIDFTPEDLADPEAAAARFTAANPTAPPGAATRFLAGLDTRLRARDEARFLREQTRIAEMEKRLAMRRPAVTYAVDVARDHIMDAGKRAGVSISRQRASRMVGEEVFARVSGQKAVEDLYIARGMPEEAIVQAGIGRSEFIPAILRQDPDLQATLTATVEAQLGEQDLIRQTLLESRPGDTGLTGLGDDAAMTPAMTARQAKVVQHAEKKLARAYSEQTQRRIARQDATYRGQIAAEEDKVGRIAAASQAAQDEAYKAIAEFDDTRTLTPKAWKGKGAMEASAQAIYERTIAEVAKNGDWGGATFDPHTGRFLEGGQDSGYALGVVPGTALLVDFETFTPAHIEQVIRAFQDVYGTPNTTIGTWVAEGKVYIDPGEVVPNLEDALIRAGARQQESIFDFAGNDVIQGVLKDRPDVAAAFVSKHKGLDATAKELRDIATKTEAPQSDVNLYLDLLMRQAVAAQDAGLVKHPDEFFSKHVPKFKYGGKTGPTAGALRQLVLERVIDKSLWDEAVATLDNVREARDWYFEGHDFVERSFRGDGTANITLGDGSQVNAADLFYDILAITSINASPAANLAKALTIMGRFEKIPKRQVDAVRRAMEKVTSGKATLEEAFGLVEGSKVSDRFANAHGAVYDTTRQFLAEVFAGQGIDKWTPESMYAANKGFGGDQAPINAAQALEWLDEHHPGVVERLGPDAAVRELLGRSHRAKLINFRNNLRDPHNSMDVTLDAQMERLVGEKMPETVPGPEGLYDDAWLRESEATRNLAAELTEVLGERVMPHEVQAVLWLFTKQEVKRLQTGHFNAFAADAKAQILRGEQLADAADPMSDWLYEAGSPYSSGQSRVATTHRILGDTGTETVEDVAYRPSRGAGTLKKKQQQWATREAKWLLLREQINADLAGGNTAGAVKKFEKYANDMRTKTPRSGGLAEDTSAGTFRDLWNDPGTRKDIPAGASEVPRLQGRMPGVDTLHQAFREKVLGEYMPMDDGTRGVIRVFEGGNIGTLVHENGHVLRRLLKPAHMRAVEQHYGIKDGQWKVAHEERWADDYVTYMISGKAPKGLGTTFARVKEAMIDIWRTVTGTTQRNRVHPDLVPIFDEWLNPAVRAMPDELPGLPQYTASGVLKEAGTLAERGARPPKFPQPPAKSGDFYRAGRKGAQALARKEKLEARQKVLAASAAKSNKRIEQIRTVLNEGRLPAELERDALVASSARMSEKIANELLTPSIKRTPARWQPVWNAALELRKMAETNPEINLVLDDLPETLQQVQDLALNAGFDPKHVRDFTPAQVRRLVFGNMRLGLGRELGKEVQAGTRTTRSGVLARAGGVDRSVEAFLAATIEAVSEKRTNAVVSWVEGNMARTIEKGQPIPEGWAAWDPYRTYLLTGTDVSGDVATATAAKTSMIVPEAALRTLDRFSKDYDHWAWQGIRKVTSPWRTLVLTLSPGWYTRNVVGNMLLATAEGAKLSDWKAAWASARTKDSVGRFADIPFVTSDTLAQEALAAVDTSVIPRRGVREAAQEGGRLRGTAQHISRQMLRANEVVDEFARAAVYHKGLRRNMTPEQAWHRAKEALVDYNALSPFERSAVRAVVPFYAWQKGILKVTLNQALDHPGRVAVTTLLGRMQEEYIADRFGVEPEDVPDYYKHLVGDRNLRSFNPFADPSEIVTVEGITRSMNPFMELAIRKGLGAPEFYTDDQRLGFFGTPQQDVDVPSALAEMVTRSPGGRILGEGPGLGILGLQPVDDAALRSRFLKARKQIRGIPNPETGGEDGGLTGW